MDIKNFLEHKILEEKYFLINNIENNSSRQSLWHGIRLEHAVEALDNMKIKPFTSQRYWPNGVRLKEDHPNYEDSFWMYGWSMTRKKEYAMNWAGVVFEFDHEKIQQQFEIKPFSWNFLFKHKTNNRKEYEEFVVSSYFNKSIPQLKKEQEERFQLIDELYGTISKDNDLITNNEIKKRIEDLNNMPNWMTIREQPKGKELDLNICLKGIYIEDYYIQKNFENIDKIMNHPKFKGTFTPPQEKEEKRKLLKI